jgi:hypothetical protein
MTRKREGNNGQEKKLKLKLKTKRKRKRGAGLSVWFARSAWSAMISFERSSRALE